MFWLDETALAGGATPRQTNPGGQPLCSELAAELVLTLRLVFRLALRLIKAASMLRLLGLMLVMPDQITLI